MQNTLDILDCTGARVGEYTIPAGVIELEKEENKNLAKIKSLTLVLEIQV